MSRLPTGTVTFLFTDIEGSTRRWEEQPGAMRVALERHDLLLRRAIEGHGGYIFKTVGDAFCAAFPIPAAALDAALSCQRDLQDEPWDPDLGPLKVRMALHTGAAQERDGDYFGPPVNRVARLLATAHGGQILVSQTTYELVSDAWPAGILRDLGQHRLKDLSRPEHIYQVSPPGLPEDFPPLKTLDSRPNNLPIQPTALIGREKDAAALQGLLMRPDVRLVTLTGPGGIGKTRLALELAANLIDSFPDGVYFVPLDRIADPDLFSAAILEVLPGRQVGPPGSETSLLAILKDYLRGKSMLLVLDNFEQIVAAARQVAELLSVAAQLKVLVTSRTILHVRGEKEFPLPPLDLPDPQRLPPLERMAQYDAVRLFAERASDVKPDFALTEENATAVGRICGHLDGLPLALELAAARIRFMTPQEMIERLVSSSSSLRLLTGGARDLPARQQALRNTIAWSYDLLSPAEQALFCCLAVFRGGCTFEAAEAVCGAGDPDVLEGISSLSEKSLLRQEGLGETRFRMLETIREYGLERL